MRVNRMMNRFAPLDLCCRIPLGLGYSRNPMKHRLLIPPTRGRPRQNCVPKPIAPYSRDPIRALGTVCDRVTGEPVNAEQLKTYAEALAQYHLNCEDKFSNGQFCDRGRTERRHVIATGSILIGK